MEGGETHGQAVGHHGQRPRVKAIPPWLAKVDFLFFILFLIYGTIVFSQI